MSLRSIFGKAVKLYNDALGLFSNDMGIDLGTAVGMTVAANGGFASTGAGTNYLSGNITTSGTAINFTGPVQVANFNGGVNPLTLSTGGAIIMSMVFAYFAIWAMKAVKVDIVARVKLENKEMFSENGAYLGRIMGVDPKESAILYRSPLGQKLSVSFEDVTSVGERVIVN